MSDLVSARYATGADISQTAQFAEAAMSALREERGGRWHLDHDMEADSTSDRHQGAIESATECLVVGCIDDIAVGYAWAFLSPTTDGQLCMIEELVVHPEAQAIGVGSAILAHVQTWAVEHECQAIESQVLPGNRAAKNFFERVGMKTRKMRVSANL